MLNKQWVQTTLCFLLLPIKVSRYQSYSQALAKQKMPAENMKINLLKKDWICLNSLNVFYFCTIVCNALWFFTFLRELRVFLCVYVEVCCGVCRLSHQVGGPSYFQYESLHDPLHDLHLAPDVRDALAVSKTSSAWLWRTWHTVH